VDDQARVMIRTHGGKWRAPSVSSYPNERELQQILMDAPGLIPGVGTAVVADELSIPGSGFLDLLAVEPDGTLTLVECKLAANAEVRRSVVGQICSYAAGLWQMSYEDLDSAFRTRTKTPLAEAVAGLADESWDAEEFRRAITAHLADGEFRLVLALDAITDELKLIVEFLNAHTASTVEVLAVEMGYVAEGDTEILLPVTHGLESARLKASSPSKKKRWTTSDVYDRLEELCGDEVVARLRDLDQFLDEHDGYWQPGSSSYPTMSAYFKIGPSAARRSVLAIYAEASGSRVPRMTLNFDSLLKGATPEQLETALAELETSDTLRRFLTSVRTEGFSTHPTLPITDFAMAGGPRLLAAAILPLLARPDTRPSNA